MVVITVLYNDVKMRGTNKIMNILEVAEQSRVRLQIGRSSVVPHPQSPSPSHLCQPQTSHSSVFTMGPWSSPTISVTISISIIVVHRIIVSMTDDCDECTRVPPYKFHTMGWYDFVCEASPKGEAKHDSPRSIGRRAVITNYSI